MRGMSIVFATFVCTFATLVWGDYHPCTFDNHTSAQSHFLSSEETSRQNGDSQKTTRYPGGSYASSMAQRALVGLERLAAYAEQNFVLIDQLRSQDELANADVARLRNEKEQAVKDLGKENYCSQCLRSKAEIEEEEGIDFNTHLRMISGFPVAAPLKRIEDKEQQYDGRIMAAESDKKRRFEHIKGLRADNKRIFFQLSEGVALWRTAVDIELALLAVRLEEDQVAVSESLAQARTRFSQAEKRLQDLLEIGPPEPAAFAEVDLQKQTWRDVVSLQEQQLNLYAESAAIERKRIEARRDGERVRVHAVVTRIFTAAAVDEYFAGYSPASISLDGEQKPGGTDFNFGSLEPDNGANRAEIAAFLNMYNDLKKAGRGNAVVVAEPAIVADPPRKVIQGKSKERKVTN